MSVHYDVKEHVVLRNEACEKIKYDVVETIAKIGYKMLCDCAAIWKLSLKADGAEYSFNGSEVTPELHRIIRAIDDANNLELVIDYDGYNIDFTLAECIEKELKEAPELSDHLFYSLYNKADCESGTGALVAFGKKNNTVYSGVVSPALVKAPVAGEWVSEDTSVVFDDDITDGMDADAIKKCVSEYIAMGADVDFDEENMSFYLNYITLKSAKDVEKFVEIYNELNRATCGKCSYIAEFADKSADDVRVMIIDFKENEEYSIEITEIN